VQTPAPINLRLPQGATWDIVLTWTDDEGLAIDVTDYTAAMQARTRADDTAPTIDLSSADGTLILGGAAGTINIHVSAADTALYPAGRYRYDLEVASGPEVTRLIEGSLEVTPEITREVTP
jgi:hypothetical protein